jgi:hypothetical protein
MIEASYIKVRHGRESVEFFFHDATTLATARRQAERYQAMVLESAEGVNVETTVFRHGVPALGHLRCVGGCDLCAPRALRIVDDGV